MREEVDFAVEIEEEHARSLADRLALRVIGIPQRAAGGYDVATFRVRTDGQGDVALRITQAARLADLTLEAEMMACALGAGLPVPRVLGVGSWNGLSAIANQWLPGQTVDAALRSDPSKARQLGAALGRAQATLHRVPVDGLPPSRWAMPQGPEEADLLGAAIRPGERPGLAHFDYHPRNVLTDGRKVTAVLDWTNAGRADVRLDIARTHVILRWASEGQRSAPLRQFARAWRDGYAEVAGRPEGMEPFLAWACVRTIRDLGERLDAGARERFRRWAAGWLRRGRR